MTENRFGYIYILINKINGKGYVGQTTQDIDSRLYHHSRAYGNCPALHSAIIKYGFCNFDIEYERHDINSLDEIERRYIEELQTSSPNGYNLLVGGNSNKCHSLETRDKISKSLIGHKLSDKTKKALLDSRLGSKLSKDHRAKISEGLRRSNHRVHINGHTHDSRKKNVFVSNKEI